MCQGSSSTSAWRWRFCTARCCEGLGTSDKNVLERRGDSQRVFSLDLQHMAAGGHVVGAGGGRIKGDGELSCPQALLTGGIDPRSLEEWREVPLYDAIQLHLHRAEAVCISA